MLAWWIHSLSLADSAEYVTQLKATMPTVRAPLVGKQSPKRHTWAMTSHYVHRCISDIMGQENHYRGHMMVHTRYMYSSNMINISQWRSKAGKTLFPLDHVKPAHLEPSLTASEISTTEPTAALSSPASTQTYFSPVWRGWQPDQIIVCTGQKLSLIVYHVLWRGISLWCCTFVALVVADTRNLLSNLHSFHFWSTGGT